MIIMQRENFNPKNMVHYKLFICPYFREEGGGQKGYQNILIFMSLLGGGGGGGSK